MRTSHISMLGSCILRDALAFHNDTGFFVDRFVQDVHPASAGINFNFGISYKDVVDTILKQYDMPNF